MAKWLDAEVTLDRLQINLVVMAIDNLDEMMYRGKDRVHPLSSEDWELLIKIKSLLTRSLHE